jgi:2-iminobutanoate/2-iminopropanoate deaminase
MFYVSAWRGNFFNFLGGSSVKKAILLSALLATSSISIIANAAEQKNTNAMHSIIKIVKTDMAPKAIGPYSQAIIVGNMVYCSGSIPLNPVSMKIETSTIEAQTEQAIQNMSAILKQAGTDLSRVVKTTVFLKNMNDFPKMNGVYEKMFQGHAPARSTVQVAKLPLDVMVEIECIAAL